MVSRACPCNGVNADIHRCRGKIAIAAGNKASLTVQAQAQVSTFFPGACSKISDDSVSPVRESHKICRRVLPDLVSGRQRFNKAQKRCRRGSSMPAIWGREVTPSPASIPPNVAPLGDAAHDNDDDDEDEDEDKEA